MNPRSSFSQGASAGDSNFTVSEDRGAKEVPEDKMFEAIMKAHEEIRKVVDFINTIVAEIGKPKFSYPSCEVDHDMYDAISEYAIEKVRAALDTDDKTVREERLNVVYDDVFTHFEEKYPEIEIVDAPYFYDAGVFNKSERSGCILLTLDAWAGVHPSLVTIPAEWDYRVPYGLLYSKTPSRCVTAFLESLGL